MSNLLNYLTIGKRLGEQVTLPYNGDSFTSAIDGSVWKAINSKPLAYSAAYSQLLTDVPDMVTSAVNFNGPFTSNLWQNFIPRIIVGATAGGSVWLMLRSSGNFEYYYTSTDAGSTWTQRTFPVAGKTWGCFWDGTNFILYAHNTGATGVQESTDGVTWTARTAISLPLQDILFNGTQYLAWPSSGTVCATSTDRTTWSTQTCTTAANVSGQQGFGAITWNPGAGLFIAGTSSTGVYQTSPTGATWTTRTGLDHLLGLTTFTNVMFASNSTTTVAVGIGLSCATSTDGINWTSRTIDANYSGTNANGGLFYDGTRFVLVAAGSLVYYSTDGITWTRATRGTIPLSSIFKTPLGVGAVNGMYALHQTDVTSSTATNIAFPVPTTDTGVRTYVRIL